MARPYRDATELATELLDRGAWYLTPEGAVRVTGAYFPGMAAPLPVVLAPGFEYRIRQVTHEGESLWILERRAAGHAES